MFTVLRSLYSAVSGMNAFQTALDVVGNNIANVDTTGFKTGSVEFSDILSQTLTGASAPAALGNAGPGGTNPQQIGLGVNIAAINTEFTQGADQETGVPTDVALNGDGLFMVSPSAISVQPTATDGTPTTADQIGTNQIYFTRAGNFTVDSEGDLVLPGGEKLLGYLGWSPNENITAGTTISADGDLFRANSTGVTGTTEPTWPTAQNATVADGGVTWQNIGQMTPAQMSAVNISVKSSENGNPVIPGNFTIGSNGVLTVSDPATGNPVETWVIPLANFFNPGGLEKTGNNMYLPTANSGTFPGNGAGNGAIIGAAGQNGLASMQPGALEASNVNLTQEFTNMIVDQQAFDANAKVINTDNNILGTILTLQQQA